MRNLRLRLRALHTSTAMDAVMPTFAAVRCVLSVVWVFREAIFVVGKDFIEGNTVDFYWGRDSSE